MKILQVCLRVPYPPADGGTIAMYNMALALKDSGADVKILALNTKKHFVNPALLPDDFVADFKPEMVYLDASVRILPAFLNIFSSESYNISRFDIKLFHEKLQQVLTAEKFDIIQLESLFVAPYVDTIRKYSTAKIIFRAHNVEFLIWERLAASEKNFLKKTYLELLSKRLKQYELSVINKFDGIVLLTNDDKSLLGDTLRNMPVLVSPIGLDTKKYPVVNTINNKPVLFHLASMDWLPNIEAADWFLNNVYPILLTKISDFKIYFAGKSMPERLLKSADEHLIITGRVDDSKKKEK